MQKSSLLQSQTRNTLFIIGIIFVAFNLRPAITSIGPLVGMIRTDTGLSNAGAGFITTLPLLAFALLSPIAPRVAQKLSREKTIFLALILLGLGIITRSLGWVSTLFIGTGLIGIAVAFCNVLLPGMVKQSFPTKVGLMTGMYTVALAISAGIAPGISVPLAENFQLGWQGSLCVWAIIVVVAIIIWLPQLKKGLGDSAIPNTTQSGQTALYKSSIAWQLTIFMGLQSLIYFCMIAWLPEILRGYGIATETAGWMVSLVQFSGIPFNFLIPIIADRLSNQKILAFGIGFMCTVGITGLLIGGSLPFLAVCIICVGIGTGAALSLALTLMALRAENATQAGNLSGMAQSFGYLLAALGPIVMGILFDVLHSWTLLLILLIGIAIIMTIAGIGAGRNQYVLERRQNADAK